MSLPWHLYIMTLLFIMTGLNHFRTPETHLIIISHYLPNPKLLNQLSRAIELILGLLLVLSNRTNYVTWGIIILLKTIFPVNLFTFQNLKASLDINKWILLLHFTFTNRPHWVGVSIHI